MRRPRRCALFLAAAILAALAQTAVRAQPVTKHVLIIHGGPEAFPGNPVFDAALREVLFSHPTIQVDAHSEYLENEEFAETADAALLEYIRIKFAGRRPDLVIANSAPALTFVLRHRDELFPNVPVVFVSASEPDGLRAGTLRGVTGVLRLPSQVETVDLALKLHPSTRRLHVVAYAPEVDGFQARVESAMAVYSPRLTVSFTNEPTLPQALAVLKALPRDSLILWVRYSPVTKSRVIFPGEFLPEIAAAAPVPIYAALDSFLGSGAVGGMMRTSTADAHRLGAMALRILEGTPPERIAFENADVTPIFDWRALQRWGIDESALPAGAEIRYRVPTVWELYGIYIVAALVVVTAQLVLIAGLLRERARVRHADTVIRASEASLRSSYERIRHMAGRLINAQEAARAEIARDLHDDVCQRLANVSLSVSRLKRATRDIEGPTTKQAFEAARSRYQVGARRHSPPLARASPGHDARARPDPRAARALPRGRATQRRRGGVLGRRHHRCRASRPGAVPVPHRPGIVAKRHHAWRRPPPHREAVARRRAARARSESTMAAGST